MNETDRLIYERTAVRLRRCGHKDPTAQIVALAKECDYYRERIQQLLEHNRSQEAKP